MNFYHLSVKMLKKNFAQYKLYFSCNCFSVAIFFCFASLFLNEQFMDGSHVDSMISSNVIFPGMLMTAFMLLFLPLSYHIFWNARKQDYGILMSLGMSRKDAIKNIAAESLFICLLALFTGLAAGAVCSGIFYGILKYLLHIQGVSFAIPPKAYFLTCFLYGVITCLAISYYSIKLLWTRIGKMLKNHETAEKNGFFYHLAQKHMPVYWNRNLVRLSFLMRHKKEWRLRYVIVGMLVMTVTFLTSMSVCFWKGFHQDAETYAPFDLVYVSIYGCNQLSEKEAASILNKKHVVVTDSCSITFFKDTVFNYVSASELNSKLHTQYQVKEGTFLNLFQFAMDDGYTHHTTPATKISADLPEKTISLLSSGSDIEILWNQNPAFADRTVILNDHDFKTLYHSKNYWQGTIRLFHFTDWKQSKNGVKAVCEKLRQKNALSEEELHAPEATSKIFHYEKATQSGSVLILSMSFVVLMLCGAAFVFIHFRIASEKEETGRSIKSLRLMGCFQKELQDMLLFKNRIHFLIPVVTGNILSIIPCYCFNQTYRFGFLGTVLCIVSGIVIGFAVWKGMKSYSQKEFFNIDPS